MKTNNQPEDMSLLSIESIDPGELADISEIQIREDLPHDEKLLEFLEQIKNPYCFRCGDIPVRVCFSDDGRKLGQILQDYFIHIKQN